MTKNDVHILICADVNLNLIDGSSVWVTSLIGVLSQNPESRITVLLKHPVSRSILIEPFHSNKQVDFIDPWVCFKSEFQTESWFVNKKLTPEETVSLIDRLDKNSNFDIIFIRGFNLSMEIYKKTNLISKTWSYIIDIPSEEQLKNPLVYMNFKQMLNSVKYVVYQTDKYKEYYQNLFKIEDKKLVFLPPMVPDLPLKTPDFKRHNKKLVYVGKFCLKWYTKEMIDAFSKIRKRDKTVEFHMAGDKIHIEPNDLNFRNTMIDKLQNSEGVIWYRGISKKEVAELISKCDIGISWRDPKLDNSMEISTKLLEYGRLGKPVILNRTQCHEELLGVDYPLFANCEDEFINKIQLAFKDPGVYEKASKKLYEVCKRFTYSEVYKTLSSYIYDQINSNPVRNQQTDSKIKLLFAGHDLKFVNMLIDYFKSFENYEVNIDLWQGHNKHDEQLSMKYLNWADVIVCEWGLGNAVWYSKYKRPDQILLVRMHRQELDTPYPHEFTLSNINKIITIAPQTTRAFVQKFNFPQDKLLIIYNLIDTDKLNQNKTEDSIYNLGILGYCPSMKRLDRALDIFENLWLKDQHFKLFIKGKLPNQYPWLMKRETEAQYYQKIFDRIEKSKAKANIIIDPWDSDVSSWFTKIGFILSVSNYEGSHVALAEGMASGSIPVIWNWEGANEQYPSEFVFNSIDAACNFIYNTVKNENIEAAKEYVKGFIAKSCDKKLICNRWKDLIEEYLIKNSKL